MKKIKKYLTVLAFGCGFFWYDLSGALAQVAFDASGANGGSIIPGNSTTCTAGTAGAIRNNGGTLETCDGSTWNGLGSGGGGGTADRIVSTSANVVVGNGGTISFTTGGVSGTAYFDTVGRLVGPGVSTTGPISGTTLYVGGAVTVSGAAVVRPVNNGSGTSFNWAVSNAYYTSATCGSFTFTNMVDGGVYTLAVQNTTSNTCVFSHTGLTFRGFSGYGTTASGGHTVFVFHRLGTVVYVTAIRGLV